MKAGGLTVASGVTAVGDLDKGSSFKLNGDLNNFGSVYAVNTQGNKGGSADINADNIVNNEGALISSNAGSHFGNKANSIDLSLNAKNDFTNLGNVESSGDLNIAAGNSIKNGTGSQIKANNNLNLSSPNIANAGTVSSVAGDITVTGPDTHELNVDNTGGTLQALEGAINVRAPNYDGEFNSNVTGGDLLSKEFNMNTGRGMTEVNVGELTGQVNGAGLGAHVEASTDEMVIGKICMTGDPTFKNTSGNITLNGDIIVGEALAILASGDITATAATNLIQARTGTVGQQITLAAGFSVSAAGNNTGSIPPLAGQASGSNVTLTNGGTGGNIDLSAATGLIIDSSGTLGDGGNVTIAAQRVGAVGGNVLLASDSLIATSGSGFGATNGNVLVLAGADNAGAITLGSIDAYGGAGSVGGNITVLNTNPNAGAGVVYSTTGALIGSNFTLGTAQTNAGILIGNGSGISRLESGGAISIGAGLAGAGVNVANIVGNTGGVSVTSTGNADLFNSTIDTNGGALNVTSTGTGNARLFAGGAVTTDGGAINFISNGGIVSSIDATSIDTAGGNFLVQSLGTSQVSGPITTGGGTATINAGGNILLQGALDTAGGAGGDVSITGGAAATATVQGITTGGGDITVSTGITNVNGNVDATNGTTGGAVSFNSNGNPLSFGPAVGAVSGGTLSLTSTGSTISVINGMTFTANQFTLAANSALVVGGGTGQLTIQALTDGTVTNVGSNGGLGISTAELGQISAGTLVIGNAGRDSDINITNPLNVSGAGAGNYNLSFLSAGDFTVQGGNNITLGARNFNVNVGGNVQLDNLISATTGNVTVNAGGNSLGFVANANITTTTGDVSLTSAGAIGTGIFNVTTTGGDIALTATGGNILANNLTVSGAGTVTLLASGDVNVNNLTSVTGGITSTATTGINFISGNVTTTGGSISLNSGTDTDVLGDLSVTGAGFISIVSGATTDVGSITTQTGNVALQSGTDTDTDDINTTSGDITITSGNTTDTNNTDITSTLGGDINITSTLGDTDVRNVSTTGAGVINITSGNDTLGRDLTTANGPINVDSGRDTIVRDVTTTVNTGSITLNGDRDLITRNISMNGAVLTLTSGRDILVNNITGLGNTDLVLTAVRDLAVNNVTLSAAGRDIILNAGRDLGANNLSAGGVITLGATRDVTTNDLDTNVGAIAVTSGRDASLNNVTTTTGAITLLSDDDTNVNNINSTSGDISVTSTTDDTTTNNISTGGAGFIEITSGDNTTTNNITKTGGSGRVQITSGDNTTTNNITSSGTGRIEIDSVNDTTVGSVTKTGTGFIDLHSGNNTTANGDITTTTGAITIASDLGDTTINNLVSTGGDINVTSGNNTDGLIVGNANISTTGAGVINITSGNATGTLDLSTVNGDITVLSNGSVAGIGTAVDDVTSTTGNVSISSTAGATVTGDITTAGNIVVSADGAAFGFGVLTGALNTSSGAGSITVTGTIDGVGTDGLATTTGNILINSADNTVISGNISTTTGNVNITSTGTAGGPGDTTIAGTVSQAGGSLTIDTLNNATLNGDVTGTTGDVIINAGNDITVQSVILTGLGSDILFDAGGNITTNGVLQADPIVLLSAGTINLGGNVVADNGIVLVAGQDIVSSTSIAINGTATLGNAGDITLVAGANFTNNGLSVTINGASATGGNINFTGSGLTAINSNSTAVGGNGGDVTLTAFQVAGAGGQVLLPTSTNIVTSGQGLTGVSGDVNVVAGNSTPGGTAIQIGNVTTSSTTNGLNGTGDVNLVNVVPTGGFVIDTAAATGSISGTLFGNSTSPNNILAGNIRAAGADVNVFAGQNAQVGTVNVSGNSDPGADGGNIFIETNGTLAFNIGAPSGNGATALIANGGNSGSARNGGSIIVSELAGQGIATTGTVLSAAGFGNGDGGLIALFTTGNITLGAGTVNANGAGTGDGGVIVLAGTNLLVSGGNAFLTANAGSGAGGLIDIDMTGTTSIAIGTGANQVSLSTSGVGSTVNVTNGDNITVTGTGSFSADFINLVANQNNITIDTGASVTANNSLNLDASTNGAVTVDGTATGTVNANLIAFNNVGGNGTIIGGNMTLTSTNGDVRGTGGTQLDINANNLTVNALGGAVNLLEVDSVNIAAASSSLADFDIEAGTDITSSVGGTMTSTAGNLSLTANNGVISLNADVTADDDVDLTSGGNMTNLAGTVVTSLTGNMSLTSTNGNIGTSAASRFNVSVANLLAVNAPNGSAFINALNSVNLDNSLVNGTLNVLAAQDLTVVTAAALTGNNIILRAQNGTFQMNAGATLVANNRIAIRANTSIENSNLDNTVLDADQVDLTSDAGDIGGAGAIIVDATNVTANAFGNVAITENAVDGLNIGAGSSSAGGTFTILANGNLSNSGTITATDVVLASGATLTLNALVTGTNSVSLTSVNSILNGNLNGNIATSDLTLTSTTGSIGTAANSVLIDAVNVTLNADDDIFVEDTLGGLNVVGANATNGDIDILASSATGFLTSSGTINAPNGSVTLESALNSVTLGAAVNAFTSISITAFNNITNASFTALNAPEINLTSTGGSIGTSPANRVNLTATQATFNALNDVFVFNNGNLILGPGKSGATGTFDVDVNGTLTVNGGIDPAFVVLNAVGDINIASLITATVSITATAGGNILRTAVAGFLDAPVIDLVATSGSIGTGAVNGRISLDADDLSANAGTNVFISDINAVNVDQASSSNGGGVFDLLATGDLTTTATIDAIGAGGDVVLRSTGGLIDLGADVTAADNASVRASGDVTTSGGAVVSAINAQLTSDNGDIGAVGNRVNVDLTGTLNLTANSGGAIAYVQGVGNLTLGTSSVEDTLNVHTDNNLTTTGILNSEIINLRANAGSLTLGGTIIATTRLNLRSNGDILDANINAATITTPQANLTSDGGDIILNNSLNVASLTANAFGDVSISTTNGVNIGPGGSSAGGSFNIFTGNNGLLSVNGTINANSVFLDSDGLVSIQDAVTGTTSIEVEADGNIVNADLAGGLFTQNLSLRSNFGNIGTSAGNRVLVDVTNLTVNAANGSVFVRDTAGGVNLGGLFGSSNADGELNIRSDNFLTNSASLSSSNGDVTLISANSSITLGASVTADQNVNITADTNVTTNVGGTINANNGDVSIIADNGTLTIGDTVTADANIGLDAGTNLTTTAGGTLNAGTNVNAFVGGNATFNGDVNASQNAAGGITVAAAGNIVTGATADLDGDFVSLTAALGFISLADDVTANNGNITLSGLLGVTTAASSILDASNDVIATSGLNINIGDDVNAGGTINFTASGNVTTTNVADLDADVVDLEATNGAITLNDTVTSNNGDVTLTAGTDITTTAGAQIDADNNLTAAAGGSINLGEDVNAGNDIDLTAVNGVSTTNIADLDAGQDVNILVSGGSANLNDTVTAGRDINIDAATNINTTAGATFNAGNDVNLIALGDINLGEDVTATNDVIATAQNINSTAIASIFGNTVDLRATTGGFDLDGGTSAITSVTLRSTNGITNANVSGGLGAPQINLTSDNGNIGTNTGSRLALDFQSVSAVASNGSVFLSDTAGTLNIGGLPSFASVTFDALAVGDITTSDNINAAAVVVRSTGGSLTVGSTIDAVNSIDLRALNNVSINGEVTALAGANTINVRADNGILVLNADVTGDAVSLRSGSNMTSPLGVAVGNTITLLSDNGNIGVDPTNRFVVDTNTLTVNAPNGSAFVRDIATGTVGLQTSDAGLTLDVVTTDNLDVQGQLTGTDIALRSTNAFFFINANVIASNSVSLRSAFDITDGNFLNQTVIQAPNTTLTADTGSIGAFGNTLDLDLNTASFNAANGDVYFFDPTNLIIGGATTNVLGVFDVTANGALSTTAVINSGDVFLTSVNSTLTIGANVNAAFSADFLSFGNMTTTGGAAVNAFDIALQSTNGNIGTNAGSRFEVDANDLQATANFGSVFINDIDEVNFDANSFAFGTFDVTAGGNITQDALTSINALNVSLNSGGSFILGGTIGAINTIDLTSVGSILPGGVGPTTLSAIQVNLTSITGSIGLAPGFRLVLDADNVTANAANGSVFIDGIGTMNIGLGSSTALFTFDVIADTLSTSGPISANDVSLTSDVGGLTINGNVTGTNTVALNSATTLQQFGGTITGGDLSLTYTAGNPNLTTSVDTITTNAAGTNLILNNTGNLVLLAQSVNNLIVNNSGGSLDTGAVVTVTGDLSLNTTGGSVNLFNDINAGNNVALSAQGGTIFQAGGTNIDGANLDVSWTAGNVTLVSTVDSLDAFSPANDLTITNTGNLTLGSIVLSNLTVIVNSDLIVSSDINLVNVNLQANTGSIILNADVNGSNSVTLTAFDTITQQLGEFVTSSGLLTLNFNTNTFNNPVTLATNVGSLTANGNGASLTINEGDNINLNAISDINALAINAFGDINIGANVSATSSIFSTAVGDITQTAGAIITDDLQLVGNGTINIIETYSLTNAQSITVTGNSVATVVSDEFGTVTLQASTASSLTLDAAEAVAVTTAGDTTVTGVLDITTTRLNNSFDLTGSTINVQSALGSGLTIDGDGGTGSLTATGPGQINLEAETGDLTFIGNQNFFGVANLYSDQSAPFGAININAGANVIGDSAVNLFTCTLNLAGNLVGDPINLFCPTGGGTIANSQGNVVLTSDINFVGLNFAIIASGSIIASGINNINLSNPTGDGGTLTMYAGFDFTPATGGQIDNTPILFTLNGPSLTGGNVDMGGVNINTGSTFAGGIGGNVNVAAVDGAVFNGNVTLGNIDTTSPTGTAGTVNVIAGGDITINGAINTSGLTAGNVNLSVTDPQQVGIVRVANGDVFGGGAIIGSGLGADGNIFINNNINAGNGTVNLLGANTLADQITQNSGTITAQNLNLTAGTGTVTLTTAVDFIDSNANGDVNVTNTGFLTISSITGATQNFIVDNNGGVLTNATINIGSLAINEFSVNGIAVNGSVTTVNDLSLANFGGGNITVAGGGSLTTTGAGDIIIDADALATADVLLNGTISSANDVLIEAGDQLTINNTISAVGTVDAIAGDVNVNAAITTTNGDVLLEGINNVIVSGNINSGNSVLLEALNNVTTNNAVTAVQSIEVIAGNDATFNNTLTATNGDVLVGALNNVSVNAAISAGNDVNLEADNTLTINATLTAGDDVDLYANTGDITINAAVTAANDVTALTSSTDINVNGAVTATAGLVDLNAASDIVTTAVITAGTTATLFTGIGDIVLGADVLATTGATLDAGNSIVINNNVNIDGGTSVTLLAFAPITGNAAFDLSLFGDDSITSSQDINVGGNFNALGSNAGSTIALQAVTAGANVTLTADNVNVGTIVSGNDTTINAANGFTTNGNITASDDVTIRTNVLNNSNVITGDNVNVTSLAGSGLTINGGAGGTFTATSGNVNLGVFDIGDVTFTGATTFNGPTFITPGGPGFGVVITNGAVVTGVNDVTLNTCLLTLQGNGSITANVLHFNCPEGAGTIANSSGDVDLTGLNLTFNGLSLAIIASGDVFTTGGTTLDLSNTTSGDGGNLLVVAGFDFTPATAGQVGPNDTVYTFTGNPSLTGGDIALSGVNVTTNGAVNGNGGNITLVAAAGNVNAGAIDIGNLTANGAGTGNGGDILVIAEGGFTTGTISNTGVVSGTTTLAAATPTIVNGPAIVGNGELLQGQFTFGAVTGSGTIANMIGDVDLSALNLTFVGEDLAIIASGNVNAGTNTIINLSNPGGAGGDLLVVAGFDFSPSTGNTQVDFNSFTTYTFTGAGSATGGDINFAGLSINTNGNGGDAGNITLVAKGGGINDGAILVNSLSAVGSGGGNGGDILLIAEDGFNIGGTILNNGATNGTTTLAAAVPVITGTINVLDGTQGGGGSFTFATPTGAGTIANSAGDVNISGTIQFTGLSLAILASNNINASNGTVINLSDAGGIGGGLTMIAGFDFTPGTGGIQVNDNVNVYTITGPNAAGGNINAAGLSIDTTGLTAAGDILAVANGGTVASGAINIGGAIDASSTGDAGTVTIIGEGGVTTGFITTTGATGGDVNLLVAQPVVSGTLTVQNGNLLSGTFVAGAFTNGLINVAGVDSGNSVTISANTGAGAGITVGNILADQDINITNTGSITISDDLVADLGEINVLANDVAGSATLLTINDGVQILANTEINLVNTGSDKKLDFLALGAGATIATFAKTLGQGDVNIRLGAVVDPANSNSLPKSKFTVTETGGGTFNLFGKKPKGSKPMNFINATGANVNLSNAFKAKNLTFGGGTTVTADPPVAAGSATYVNGRLVSGTETNESANTPDASGLAAALNLVQGSFDQVQANANNGNILSVTGIDATANVANSLTANAVVNGASGTGTAGNTTKTETLFGGVSAAIEGEDNSYMVSSSTGPIREADASICSDADLGTAGNATHLAHTDRVVLKQGNVLFVPFRNTVVETPQGNVTIEAKSVALVSVSNGKLAVYDLEDSHKGAVSIEAHGQKVTLAPGNHLTIAQAKSGEFAQVNAIEAIPHRNVATRALNTSVKLHTSEFSVVSAMQSIKPLQAVMGSKHPQAKKVADRMMKTTAVLLTLGGKGEFQHFFKPAITAMK